MGRFRSDSFVEDEITTIQLALVEDKSLRPGTLFIADWCNLPPLEFQMSVKCWLTTIDKFVYDYMVTYTATMAELKGEKEIGRKVILEVIEKKSGEKALLNIDRDQFDELLTDKVLVESDSEQEYTKAMLRGLNVRR